MYIRFLYRKLETDSAVCFVFEDDIEWWVPKYEIGNLKSYFETKIFKMKNNVAIEYGLDRYEIDEEIYQIMVREKGLMGHKRNK